MGKLGSHVLSASVYRYAVDDRVASSEVNILKRVRRVGPPFHDLAEVDVAAFLDEHGLAGKDVANVAETKLPQSNGLGGEEIVFGSRQCPRGSRSDAERSNSIGIPKPKNAKARDHSSAGEGADAFGVDVAKGREDLIRVDPRLSQLVE